MNGQDWDKGRDRCRQIGLKGQCLWCLGQKLCSSVSLVFSG
ncbi:MAG: hypothetical protein AAGD09_12105 [Cyanobacteria bacterium P01_F01_bin.56]